MTSVLPLSNQSVCMSGFRDKQGVQIHLDSISSKHDTSPSVGLMLDQRMRRWLNIDPTLAKGVVFAGMPAGYGIADNQWSLVL